MSLLWATGLGVENIQSRCGPCCRLSGAGGVPALPCNAYRCSTKWVRAPSASCIHQPSPSALAASRSAFSRQCSRAAWIALMGLAYSAACRESGVWGADRQKHQVCCWRVTAAYGRMLGRRPEPERNHEQCERRSFLLAANFIECHLGPMPAALALK